jgi:hypothetical protein
MILLTRHGYRVIGMTAAATGDRASHGGGMSRHSALSDGCWILCMQKGAPTWRDSAQRRCRLPARAPGAAGRRQCADPLLPTSGDIFTDL